MKHLREAKRRKKPEWWRNKTWMLHHNNAPAHMSFLVSEFLAKHETNVIPQPPYSPDLVPAYFFFVPDVEIHHERWPISDDRGDGIKFAMRPTQYPAKRIPELEKMLEAVYRGWRGVL
jgi:hypothetical protein